MKQVGDLKAHRFVDAQGKGQGQDDLHKPGDSGTNGGTGRPHLCRAEDQDRVDDNVDGKGDTVDAHRQMCIRDRYVTPSQELNDRLLQKE